MTSYLTHLKDYMYQMFMIKKALLKNDLEGKMKFPRPIFFLGGFNESKKNPKVLKFLISRKFTSVTRIFHHYKKTTYWKTERGSD